MPQSVYSIRAEAALSVHLRGIEKLLTLETVTGKIEEAIREHLTVAKAAVIRAHDHAAAAGHMNESFEREHLQRLEKIAAIEARRRLLPRQPAP